VTIATIAKTCNRVPGNNPNSQPYRTDDGLVELKISQLGTKSRRRREVRITQFKVAVDPISSANKDVSMSTMFVIDEPLFGFSQTEKMDLLNATVGYINGGTARTKLLNGEV
jgi:hypothetical protein